jgi:hypothetical protein
MTPEEQALSAIRALVEGLIRRAEEAESAARRLERENGDQCDRIAELEAELARQTAAE